MLALTLAFFVVENRSAGRPECAVGAYRSVHSAIIASSHAR